MTTTLWFGDLRTGRLLDTIDASTCPWSVKANGAGSINATIHADEVRAKNLRQAAPATKTFLAVEVDGQFQEAGPIWSRTWDGDTLTLGAAGLWSLFDHRMVLPAFPYGQRIQDLSLTVRDVSLGGIARALVSTAMSHVGGNLPLIVDNTVLIGGTHTETFPGWKMLKVGDQLRELTAREVGAPDIRFRPRFQTDRRYIQWVLEHGSEAQPTLSQLGEDWVFDANPMHSPVTKITTDEDATIMAERGYVTGNGQENDTLIGFDYDPTLVDAGWPLLEIEEPRPTVEEQSTVNSHASNLVDRSARPIETWTVNVRASAAVEVLPFDYARVIPDRNDPWLVNGITPQEAYMRVKTKSGDLGGDIRLEMYPVRGSV